jgi:hypothetical protein
VAVDELLGDLRLLSLQLESYLTKSGHSAQNPAARKMSVLALLRQPRTGACFRVVTDHVQKDYGDYFGKDLAISSMAW